MTELLFTSYAGNENSALIEKVAAFYLKPGMKIADITWGKGAFWKSVDLGNFDFHASDILACEKKFRPKKGIPYKKYDLRDLPYKKDSFDVIILDPPYCHNPGRMIVNANYKNAETTKGMYHRDIMDLYRGGISEAWRILKIEGQLWVKCQDEIESSYQRWSHIEICDMASEIGFFGKDLFIFTQQKDPHVQHKAQQHARKNHSYLWIFKKPNEKEARELKRFGIIANGSIPLVSVSKKGKMP